jgi:hypothetical protein
MEVRAVVLWLSSLLPVTVSLLLLTNRPACAEGSFDNDDAHAPGGAQEHADAPHDGHKKNLLAIFIGDTHEGRRQDDLAIGIEYERRLSNRFGIGALVEHTFADEGFTVYAVPFAIHSGPWKFYAAPGVEERAGETEDLFRLGVEYGFEVGRFEISPQFDIDLVDSEEVYVLGVTFGLPF